MNISVKLLSGNIFNINCNFLDNNSKLENIKILFLDIENYLIINEIININFKYKFILIYSIININYFISNDDRDSLVYFDENINEYQLNIIQLDELFEENCLDYNIFLLNFNFSVNSENINRELKLNYKYLLPLDNGNKYLLEWFTNCFIYEKNDFYRFDIQRAFIKITLDLNNPLEKKIYDYFLLIDETLDCNKFKEKIGNINKKYYPIIKDKVNPVIKILFKINKNTDIIKTKIFESILDNNLSNKSLNRTRYMKDNLNIDDIRLLIKYKKIRPILEPLDIYITEKLYNITLTINSLEIDT